jgi:transketolase
MRTMAELERIAWEIRLALIEMFSWGKAHHFGGSLSCAEIVAALYFHKMNYSAAKRQDPCRDRFIMSKGHSVPAQYAALAMLGVFSTDELRTIKQLGSRLQGHPDVRKTPGIEACTGSLGQGLSFANGIAMAARLDGLRFNIFVLVGDGELQEGQMWEAAMTTSHYGLNNICLIVDRNRYQSQGEVDALMRVEPIQERWQSFGWRTVRIDGHCMKEVCGALDQMGPNSKQPLAIIADTVKGKGAPFLEGTYVGHNAAITEAQYIELREGIRAKLQELEAT